MMTRESLGLFRHTIRLNLVWNAFERLKCLWTCIVDTGEDWFIRSKWLALSLVVNYLTAIYVTSTSFHFLQSYLALEPYLPSYLVTNLNLHTSTTHSSYLLVGRQLHHYFWLAAGRPRAVGEQIAGSQNPQFSGGKFCFWEILLGPFALSFSLPTPSSSCIFSYDEIFQSSSDF